MLITREEMSQALIQWAMRSPENLKKTLTSLMEGVELDNQTDEIFLKNKKGRPRKKKRSTDKV